LPQQIEGTTKLEYYQDKGILSFSDESDKVLLTISSPLVLSSDKTSTTQLTWDGSISVPLPPDTKFPAVLTFGISTTAPEPEAGIEAFFPDVQIGADGDVVEVEVEVEGEELPSEVGISYQVGEEGEYTAEPYTEDQSVPSETGVELGKVLRFAKPQPNFKNKNRKL
jgi:hypothetical protein